MRRQMLVGCLLVALAGGSAAAQRSRCADCHFANPEAPARAHLSDWDRSAHGRHDVGCENCHGGNPATFESFQAHQGILNSRNPASPVHRWNLPRTCGRCHAGPFVEFQKSRHYELLRGGDPRVPTCSSCHGEVAAHLLAPRALEGQCAACHGRGKPAERPEYPAQARLLLSEIRQARDSLRDAARLIRRVKDQERRASLEYRYEQAEVPLIQATQAGHAFVFDGLEERLSVAQQRIESLLDALVVSRD